MDIKYSPNYKNGDTQFWCIHHTGGILANNYASTKLLTADTINKAHKERWNFISSLGYFGGYNFFIDYQGNLTQFRAIGSETAAQKGYNQDGQVISICFAGNFTKGVDTPSAEQIASFRRLTGELPKIKFQNIKPHRYFTGSTECFGSGLKEDWARNLVPELDERNNFQILLNQIQLQILQIQLLLKSLRLGGSLPKCEESARG